MEDSKLIQFLFIVGFVLYGIKLILSSQLGFYLHPRFFTLSILAVVFMLLAAVYLFIYYYTNRSKTKTINISSFFKDMLKPLNFLTLAAIVFGLLIPAAPLSSSEADRRNQVRSVDTQSDFSVLDVFVGGTEQYTLADWYNSLLDNPDPKFYIDKKVKISGFASESDIPGTFNISRFVISCCVVDAAPVSLPVGGSFAEYNNGNTNWIEVQGEFSILEDELVIVPSKIDSIPRPELPYIY